VTVHNGFSPIASSGANLESSTPYLVGQYKEFPSSLSQHLYQYQNSHLFVVLIHAECETKTRTSNVSTPKQQCIHIETTHATTSRSRGTHHLRLPRRRPTHQHHRASLEFRRRDPRVPRLQTRVQTRIHPLVDILRLLRSPRLTALVRLDTVLWHGLRRDRGHDLGLAGGHDRHPVDRFFDGGALLFHAHERRAVLCCCCSGAAGLGSSGCLGDWVVELAGSDHGCAECELWGCGYDSCGGEYSKSELCSDELSGMMCCAVVRDWGGGSS
jgi:hypothetical protein